MPFVDGSRAKILAHLRTPLYKNAYALTASAGLTSALGMGFWVVAAHHYSAGDVGRAGAAIAAMTLLQGIAALYLDGVLIRFVPVAGTRTERLVTSVLGLNIVLSTVVTLVFLAGLSLWSPRLEFLRSNIWIAIGFLILTVGSSNFLVQDGALTGLRMTNWVLAKNGILAVARILLLVLLSPLLGHVGILAAWIIAAAIMLIPSNAFLLLRIIPERAFTRSGSAEMAVRDLGSYALGNYVAAVLNVASNSLLPLIVLREAGGQASAHFYLPWTISLAIRLIPSNMSSSLIVEGTIDRPRLLAHCKAAIINTGRQTLLIACVLVLGAPYILRIFGPGYSGGGATVLRLLALAALPNIVNTIYIAYARVRYRVLGVVLLQGALVVSSLGLSLLFLPDHGIEAVALVWLITQTCAAIILLLTALRPVWKPSVSEASRPSSASVGS